MEKPGNWPHHREAAVPGRLGRLMCSWTGPTRTIHSWGGRMRWLASTPQKPGNARHP